MQCSICTTDYPEIELKEIWLTDERQLHVCDGCVADAISEMLAEVERADKAYSNLTPTTT